MRQQLAGETEAERLLAADRDDGVELEILRVVLDVVDVRRQRPVKRPGPGSRSLWIARSAVL
jgi:hypothetical protein